VVDRAACEWDAGSYFLAEREGAIAFYWFEEAPELPLLGRVIVLLRPKRLLPEDAVVESSWTLEE
ncbi:MAG: hypothetical protein HC925_05735, partial [Coleofasciculaceae cyanobacterium SM2_3_26]|nr:hypothetical protein [Coleofasciculaceae cyanobacterium SM2_3_26]